MLAFDKRLVRIHRDNINIYDGYQSNLNNNFSVQNCLTRYRSNALTVQTGTDGQNIPCHTDVLITGEHQYLYVLR